MKVKELEPGDIFLRQGQLWLCLTWMDGKRGIWAYRLAAASEKPRASYREFPRNTTVVRVTTTTALLAVGKRRKKGGA